jgi:hypothetical protein
VFLNTGVAAAPDAASEQCAPQINGAPIIDPVGGLASLYSCLQNISGMRVHVHARAECGWLQGAAHVYVHVHAGKLVTTLQVDDAEWSLVLS